MNSIFSFVYGQPRIGLPVGDKALHKGNKAADSRDTLNARMIAWILALCKKYLTKRTIRYRLMLHSLIVTCRSWRLH
jgi:hypothetical protein